MINQSNYHEVGSLIKLISELPCAGVPYWFNPSYLVEYQDPSVYEEDLKRSLLYEAIKDAPKLPPTTDIYMHTDNRKIYVHLIRYMRTTTGKVVKVETFDNDYIIISGENYSYKYNKYYKRDIVTAYIGRKAIEGSLVIEDIVLPRYMFSPVANNRIKNDLLREYEKQIKKCVFYTWHQLYFEKHNFVDCLAIDVSEVRT